jgi:hypothetical protein
MSENPRSGGDEITTSEGPRRTAPRTSSAGVGGEVTQSERDVAEHERQRTQLRQSGEASTTTSSSEAPQAASAQQELFKADFTSMREHINALRNHAMTLPNSDALAEVLLAVESAELGIARAERLVLNLPDESAERE